MDYWMGLWSISGYWNIGRILQKKKKKKNLQANKKGTSLSVTIILWKRDLTFENCSWCRENEKMFCLAGD